MCVLKFFSRLVVSTDVKYRVVSESIPLINDYLGMWFQFQWNFSRKFYRRMKFVSLVEWRGKFPVWWSPIERKFVNITLTFSRFSFRLCLIQFLLQCVPWRCWQMQLPLWYPSRLLSKKINIEVKVCKLVDKDSTVKWNSGFFARWVAVSHSTLSCFALL